MQAIRAYRTWWQVLQARRPWLAGMVIGLSAGLGCATGSFLVSLGNHISASARAANMVAGPIAAFIVASILRGALNKRRVDAATPDPSWPAPYGGDEVR